MDDAEDDAIRAEAGTNGGGGGGRSALYTSIPTTSASTSDGRIEQGSTSATSRGEDNIGRTPGAAAAPAAAAFNGHGSGGGAAEGGMTVRILDVKGQIYSLGVRPETTVHELKTRLVEEAGVEIARQRIIYGGKVRNEEGSIFDCIHHVIIKSAGLARSMTTSKALRAWVLGLPTNVLLWLGLLRVVGLTLRARLSLNPRSSTKLIRTHVAFRAGYWIMLVLREVLACSIILNGTARYLMVPGMYQVQQ